MSRLLLPAIFLGEEVFFLIVFFFAAVSFFTLIFSIEAYIFILFVEECILDVCPPRAVAFPKDLPQNLHI